jgi:hypothetical protein
MKSKIWDSLSHEIFYALSTFSRIPAFIVYNLLSLRMLISLYISVIVFARIKLYKTTNLPLLLYGYETSSPTLGEEQKTEDIWEQGAEENFWTEERWNRNFEKTA